MALGTRRSLKQDRGDQGLGRRVRLIGLLACDEDVHRHRPYRVLSRQRLFHLVNLR